MTRKLLLRAGALALLALSLFPRPAHAVPPMCTVTGTVYNVDGTPAANGSVIFRSISTQTFGNDTVQISPEFVTLDGSGNLPAGVQVPQGARVIIQVGRDKPVTVVVTNNPANCPISFGALYGAGAGGIPAPSTLVTSISTVNNISGVTLTATNPAGAGPATLTLANTSSVAIGTNTQSLQTLALFNSVTSAAAAATSIQSLGGDDLRIGIGAHFNTLNWVADATTAQTLILNSSGISFSMDTDLIVGNTFVPAQILTYNSSGIFDVVPSGGNYQINGVNQFRTGSWTPGIAFGGASVGVTYSTQSGNYSVAGHTVTLGWSITLTSKGTSTGQATITGIPFTGAGGGARWVGHCDWALLSGAFIPGVLENNGGTSLTVINVATATSDAGLTDTAFTNSTILNGSITYQF